MSTNNKIVVGIVRSSGVSEDKITLDRQSQLLRDYCKSNNLNEPKLIVDNGVSGFKNRKGLIELVALCERDKVSHVIFTSLDRLSRNLKLALELVELFNKKGITLISLSEKIDSSSASGKFQLHIMLSLAENYRNAISDKMRNTWKYKRERNLKSCGHTPFGYRVVDKKLIPDEHEQSVITKMIAYRDSGLSYAEIAKQLNDDAIPTKLARSLWSATTVYKILARQKQNNAA